MIGLEMGTVLAADLLRVFGVADLKSYTIVGQLDMEAQTSPAPGVGLKASRSAKSF